MNKKNIYAIGALALILILFRKKTSNPISGSEDFEEMQEFMVPSYATKYLTTGNDKGLTEKEKNSLNRFLQYIGNSFGNTNFVVNEKKVKYDISDIDGVPSKGFVDIVSVKFTNDNESKNY